MANRERHMQVVDEGALHKVRTEIPNTVIRGDKGRGLSLPARWLYVYLKSIAGDSGECWQSTPTMARGAQLAEGTVSQAKRELITAKLINIVPGNQAKHETDTIRILDIWDHNMREFYGTPGSPSEPGRHQESLVGTEDTALRVHQVKANNNSGSPGEPVENAESRIGIDGNEGRVHQVNPCDSLGDDYAATHNPGSPGETKKKIPDLDLRKTQEKPFVAFGAKATPAQLDDEMKAEKKTAKPGMDTYSPGFLAYHQAHPVKKGKAKAWAIWKRLRLEAQSPEIVQSVHNHIKYDPQWSRGYIKQLDTYLSAKCWEDELQVPKAGAKRSLSL